MTVGSHGFVVKSKKAPKWVKGKSGEMGRFVTLKSGKVVFIPRGQKTKWSDVKDKVLASKGGRSRRIRNQEIEESKLDAERWQDDTADQGNDRMSSWLTEEADSPVTPTSSWQAADSYARGKLKEKAAQELSDATGIPEEQVSKFIEQWAHSSNDHDMRSLAVQRDAAKEFGLELSDFTRERIRTLEREFEDDVKHEMELTGKSREWAEDSIREGALQYSPLMPPDDQRKLLRAMYDHTQKSLAVRGIKEVRVHRGAGFDDPEFWDRHYKKPVDIETNAIESWSIDKGVAADFAIRAANETQGVGIRFSTTVPAKRILCCPATGFGCLTEGEVVILGGIGGDSAIVDEMWNPEVEFGEMSEAEIEAEMGLY